MSPTPILIDIHEEDRERARDLAETIKATGLFVTPNYTGLYIEDRFFSGYLGEFVIARLLRSRGVLHTHQIVADGKSQKSEFKVSIDRNFYSLEVKTSSKPSYKMFMFPRAQLSHPSSIYAGVRLTSVYKAQVMGWLRRTDVEDLPIGKFGDHHVPTVWQDYKKMEDMESLLSRIDGVPRTRVLPPISAFS